VAADSGYWLCATPVHLQTRHHALVLADPATLDLDATQSAALAATIAAHVRGDNMVLHTPASGRWYLHCDTAPAISTTALDDVVGRDVQPYLPKGADALRWHRLLTEIQMLLHAHPVNDAREAAGRLPVNSVWLWGGGTLPAPGAVPYSAVWSDDALTRARALRAGCPVDSGTPHFPQSPGTTAHYYFSYQALTPLMRSGELQAWGAAVQALERDWFQPLQAALSARAVQRAVLICRALEGTHHFVCSPWDKLKILNKIKYL
jgi:hypothetical protein